MPTSSGNAGPLRPSLRARAIFLLAMLAFFLSSGTARSDGRSEAEEAFGSQPSKVHETRSDITDCARAHRWQFVLRDEARQKAFLTCYTDVNQAQAKSILDAAKDYLSKYTSNAEPLDDSAKAEERCQVDIHDSTVEKTEKDAKDAADALAAAMLKAAETADSLVNAQREAIDSANAVDEAKTKAQEAAKAGKKALAGVLEDEATAKQKEHEQKVAKVNAARESAENARAALQKASSEATRTSDAAKTAREAAQQKEIGRKDAAQKLREQIDELLQPLQRTPEDFRARVKDDKWVSNCAKTAENLWNIDLASTRSTQEDRQAVHATDVLRKAGGVASALANETVLAEKPGAPDRAVFSVMSALGADRSSNGTQVVMTLNLASLGVSEEQRLRLSPFLRNLFIRAALPLEATDPKESSTGTESAEEDTDAPANRSVSRFSVVLGGSLYDEADPRLPSNDTCYRAILAYHPFPESLEEGNEDLSSYYDVCHRLAAEKQRLAWRAGLGFLAENDGTSSGKTRAELIAGALVWAPTSVIYIDGLYQHLFLPDDVDTVGAGVSFAGNVGGKRAGFDSWGRVGIDVLFLVTHISGDWIYQWRIAPTVQIRVTDSLITTLSIGPRFGDNEDVGLLATVALTYDADNLLQPLLSPINPTTQN